MLFRPKSLPAGSDTLKRFPTGMIRSANTVFRKKKEAVSQRTAKPPRWTIQDSNIPLILRGIRMRLKARGQNRGHFWANCSFLTLGS